MLDRHVVEAAEAGHMLAARLVVEDNAFTREVFNASNAVAIHKATVTNTWLSGYGGLTMAGSDEIRCCNRAAAAIKVASCTNEVEEIMEKWLPTVQW